MSNRISPATILRLSTKMKIADNYDLDQFFVGMEIESEEHPTISIQDVATIVVDHLDDDPEYYLDELEDEDESEEIPTEEYEDDASQHPTKKQQRERAKKIYSFAELSQPPVK